MGYQGIMIGSVEPIRRDRARALLAMLSPVLPENMSRRKTGRIACVRFCLLWQRGTLTGPSKSLLVPLLPAHPLLSSSPKYALPAPVRLFVDVGYGVVGLNQVCSVSLVVERTWRAHYSALSPFLNQHNRKWWAPGQRSVRIANYQGRYGPTAALP
jgi:hypothetical protein